MPLSCGDHLHTKLLQVLPDDQLTHSLGPTCVSVLCWVVLCRLTEQLRSENTAPVPSLGSSWRNIVELR